MMTKIGMALGLAISLAAAPAQAYCDTPEQQSTELCRVERMSDSQRDAYCGYMMTAIDDLAARQKRAAVCGAYLISPNRPPPPVVVLRGGQ
jgi:hypothetical protein